MKRLVFASIVVLVACAIAGAIAVTRGGAAESKPGRVGVLRFRYPERFRTLAFGDRALLVADYPLSRDSPTVRIGVFPPSGVVFELFREPKLEHPIAAPAVRFPLSLSDLGRRQRPNGQTWELRFRAKRAVYWVIVWFGNQGALSIARESLRSSLRSAPPSAARRTKRDPSQARNR
jgi:hypothetical protein